MIMEETALHTINLILWANPGRNVQKGGAKNLRKPV
jgi:hypothetical protein